MTRAPRSRRPPRLDDHTATRTTREPREIRGASTGELLKAARVAGRSTRLGRDELRSMARHFVGGDRRLHAGLDPFDGLTEDHVTAAYADLLGWEGDGPRGRIDPARTVDGWLAACERVLELAQRGARLCFATTRPASLLGLHQALARAALDAGGTVLTHDELSVPNDHRRRIWWLDGVAAVTERDALVPDASVEAADELLMTLERPDLVVADGVFAGAALRGGAEVVAFAGLDSPALVVAAWRGMAVRLVPLDDRRPPAAYGPLLDLLANTEIAVTATEFGLDTMLDPRQSPLPS